MNLVEKLLATDGKIEKQQKKIKSKRIANLIGESGAEITIQEITGRQFGIAKDRLSGDGDAGFESNLMCCMYGIVDPDLKNASLQERFGVKTPKDLCEKVFGAEVYTIAGEIAELSGLTDSEEEVKN